MNNWCITDKMYTFISWDGDKVYVANPEAKKYWGPVQKISGSVTPPKTVDNTGSKVKISGGRVYLEVSGKYLQLGNMSEENLLSQLSEATLTSGEACGVIFGFSGYSPEKTILIFPGTELYKTSEEEYMRKINLSLYRKTSKFIPGNRYDTEDGSFWYLGEVVSHRGSESGYWENDYNQNKQIKSQVFSNFLPTSKKASDIYLGCSINRGKNLGLYNSKDYPNSIIFYSKFKPMIDMGKEVDLDITLEDSYEPRIDKFMADYKTPYTIGSGKYYYTDLSNLFPIFDLSLTSSTPAVSDSSKDKIKEILRVNLEYIFFKNYKISGKKLANDEGLADKLIEELISTCFFRSYPCNNTVYIKSLVKAIFKLDLVDLSKEVILNLKDIKPEFKDFKDLVENIGWFEYRDPSNYRKDIDFVYVRSENRDITKYLPDCPYRDMIKDIYKEAISTNGSNLDSFFIENLGTERTPVLKYTLFITFNDIARHFKVSDITQIPDSIKEDMLRLKIYEVKFITRSDLTPKL